MLGFIKLVADEFKLAVSLKSLYCVSVGQILEYRSVVWSPYTAGDCYQLERVPRFRGLQVRQNKPLHDYSSVIF